MIVESPALRGREQQIFARFTDSLAELIAAETGARPGDIRPWVTANALLGVHRALIGYARERILAGGESPEISRDVRARPRMRSSSSGAASAPTGPAGPAAAAARRR